MRCRLDVPGAVNVTLNELEKHLRDFDRDKEVILLSWTLLCAGF
jgi:hypothetical protein